MARKPNPDLEDVETEFKPVPSNAAKVPPKGKRDTSLVDVLVLVHNVPVGVVLDPVLDEDGVHEVDDAGEPRFAIVERRLQHKERLKMERWCADIMAARDHIVLL